MTNTEPSSLETSNIPQNEDKDEDRPSLRSSRSAWMSGRQFDFLPLELDDHIEFESSPKNGSKFHSLKIIFLSSDTGGGHRASAESLANQFSRYCPSVQYDLVDIMTGTNVKPYCQLVQSYQHFSSHPSHWKMFYHTTNSFPFKPISDLDSRIRCYKNIKRQIQEIQPDAIISVHPMMNYLPGRAAQKISEKTEKIIPFFTVCTDYGSAHSSWFTPTVDKVYVASEQIYTIAKTKGNVPIDKIVKSGLPIRHDFQIQAEKMGMRTSSSGQEYCRDMKQKININPNKKMVLVMGGGEGVGSLSVIAEALYSELVAQCIPSTVCVVCGRNESLKDSLNNKDWSLISPNNKDSDVTVIGLGFITNMADYMVATDVLVSKAGPGTIAEAASVGLPIMLTSYLPGQEAGNLSIVIDNKFGDYQTKPKHISSTVAKWLKDDTLYGTMSRNASSTGRPAAASDIVLDILKVLETRIGVKSS